MKRCCVIGGNGFIGGHLVRGLLALGRHVTVVDVKKPAPDLAPKIRFFKSRSGAPHFLADVLKGMDEVVDLAYATVPKTSFEDPVLDISANLPFAVDLFQAASAVKVKKIVILSSGGTVYGEAAKLPISETHPTNPISPYGITKLAVEKYALMFHRVYALPIVILRPGNAFGEGQRPFVGQGFIATAMASILKGKPVPIFGRHGTIRDYIYVKDLANGIIAALDSGRPGVCYNLGSGVGRSSRQVLSSIEPLAKAEGLRLKVVVTPARTFDVKANVLDSSRLKRDTGWKPDTEFEYGLSRAWDALSHELM